MTAIDLTTSEMVEDRRRKFNAKFLLTASGSIVVATFVALAITMTSDLVIHAVVAQAASLAVCGASYLLAQRGFLSEAGYALTFGITSVAAYAATTGTVGPEVAVGAMLLMVQVIAFVVSARAAFILGLYAASAYIGTEGALIGSFAAATTVSLMNLVIGSVLVLAFGAISWMFSGHVSEAFAMLRDRVDDIDAVVVRAQRVADGDLSGDVDGESDVSRVLQQMTQGLRYLVQQIHSTTTQLGASASEIGAMTAQQSQSTIEQSSAVEETRESLRSMLASSTEIAKSASEVLGNAESAVSTTQTVATRVNTLASHTERVSEILETVREIANKAELLALNAALEGTKAGEHGRGFSLVAARMQGLAEGVLEAVKGIRTLTNDIRDATNATVLSLEESTKLASATATKARQIALVCQQQRSSTEQVTEAMEDISRAVAAIAAGSDQSATATRDLTKLAGSLTTAVNRFSL